MRAMSSGMSVLLALILSLPPAAGQPATSTSTVLAHIERNAQAAHSDALLITRNRTPLLETYTEDGDSPIHLMSATKSIVALAIGLLLDDGKLASLDVPVSTIYPEWRQGQKRDITVRMLLEHTSGLQNVPNAGVELEGAPDLVQLALAAELSAAPGSTFAYNNKATNLLPGVVERLAGHRLDSYLDARIFKPLGITHYTWMKDETGTPMGMAGLSLSARDLAAIGQLMLDEGVAPDGSRLLSAQSVTLLTTQSTRSPDVGLLWWRLPAWERYSLKPGMASSLEEHGVSTTMQTAILAAEGSTFASKVAVIDFLAEQLGPSWPQVYAQEITARGLRLPDLFNIDRGPVRAVAANGYLGQHLVIVPSKNLVAVRLIHRRDSHASPVDDYALFPAEVLQLTETL